MNLMETEALLTAVGTIGGLQGVIELVKWWRGRRVQARKDTAAVIEKENDNYRKQIDWYEQRLKERDQKVDALYNELRETQRALMDSTRRVHELELSLKEAEIKRCLKRGCGDRVPPSEY